MKYLVIYLGVAVSVCGFGNNSTAQICSNLPPSVGIVSWWEGETNTLDSVGSNDGHWLNGTNYYAPGKICEAFLFGGDDAQRCVTIPYSSSLINTNYSFEAWVKPQAEPGSFGQDWIFGQCYGSQLVVRTGSTGEYVAFQFSGGGSSGPFEEVDSTCEIPLNTFSHIVGTWDGTTLKLYINGILNNSSTPGTAPANPGCDFYIGGIYHPGSDDCSYIGQFFTGVIDEVSVYNRALSANEVALLYDKVFYHSH